MTNFDEILFEIRQYAETADRAIALYRKQDMRLKERLNSTTYGTEHAKLLGESRGKLWAEKDSAKEKCLVLLNDMTRRLYNWMSMPVRDGSYLQAIVALKNARVPMGKEDIEALLASSLSKSYFGRKLICAVAEDNGLSIDMPDIGTWTQLERILKDRINVFFDNYCGADGLAGADLVEDPNSAVHLRVMASKFVQSPDALTDCVNWWGDSDFPIASSTVKNKENEAAKVREWFESVETDQERRDLAARITKENPTLIDTIMKSEFSKYLDADAR